ncbi:N-acetyl-alpha-D-glucosaminyl L-malate synthase BshA [Paludibaculum fermentans]|uniref:N-acetyl-alpha-D-glucosaminyl L-malate synthase BshA n=1 Tax=Paludibaculum fermentans TaxID=1473598 RepID=A0A7S7SHM9_PALFE|nr:N-acetyl-alpha-D-glucosaminyl L-malate synthase BshA [Paludibaculum fermentans]QOY85134.1 N-acetyl-alpha-D-glucosaminyl L-malate synthase BshA [Paludibaculum fermentans]
MRIGITCYPTYGGSGIVATELGLELAVRGHEVHFITYANPIRLDPGTPRIHYHEVEVSTYPLFQYPPYDLALASRMTEIAEWQNLDLLHVHYAIPHSASAYLARAMSQPTRRLPYITTLHGTDITLVGTDRSYFPITKFSIEQSDGVTSISDHLKQQTLDVFGVKNEVRVIHNFVNCDLYRMAKTPHEGRPRLLHISNFREVKRITDCVRVLKLVREHVDCELWMAGDGPDRGAAERLAFELGIHEHVEFLGKQDHIERLIPQCDMMLLPSRMESFGLAALEGMACGVIPVATRVGGVPEVITHGVDGFLEEVADVAAQAQRVVEVLSNPELRNRMKWAARDTAESRFCTSHIIPRYEAFYQEVLAR